MRGKRTAKRFVADTGAEYRATKKAVGFGFIFGSQVKAWKRVPASASADGFAMGLVMGIEATGEHRRGYDVDL